MADFYDDDNELQIALNSSAASGIERSPDAATSMIRAARKLGIPTSFIRHDNGAEAQQRVKRQEFTSLADIAPRTAAFVARDPDHASLLQDDLQNASDHETLLGSFAAPFIGLGAKAMAGFASNEYVGTKALDVIAQGRKLFNSESRNSQFQKGLERFSDESTDRVRYNVQYWDDIARRYGQDDSVIGRITGDLVKGLTGLPAGIVGFNPVFAGTTTAAEAAKKPNANGLDVITAGATEAVKMKGLGKIFHAVGNTGMGVAGKMATTGAAMATQTAAELAGSEGAGALATNKGMESVISSLVTGAALGYKPITGNQDLLRREMIRNGVLPEMATRLASMAPDISNVVSDARKAYDASMTKAVFEALGEKAGESKLLQRLPEKYRELVANIKSAGDVDNVFIPSEKWDTYWQEKGIEPADAAESVTGDREQYREAAQTGGDVVIPLEDFVTKLAGSEHYRGLADDIRLRPGAMTAREAMEFDERYPEAIKELRERMTAESEPADKRQSWRKVYDDVYGQLTGIYPKDTAEKYAFLTALRARTRAERLGRDARELYQESPLKVVAPLPEDLQRKTVDMGLDPLLDRLRTNDIPTDESIFGQSLLQFAREKGVKDDRGDLKGMDVDAGRKPGKKNILRKDGLSLDKLREAAVEAGYLKEGATTADLLDAMDKELRGAPVYPSQPVDSRAHDTRLALDELRDYLDQRGIDYNQLSNEQVRGALYQGEQGGELWQPGPRKRGFFRSSPDMTAREIGILKDADLSTFLHESGHSWLEELKADAALAEAPEQLKKDWETIKAWLGNDGGDLTTEQHEQFSRGAEAYIKEGKAPTPELQVVFHRFMLWLKDIYRNLAGLDVKLNDDVRKVFDRLLATDDEIEAARESMGHQPIFSTAKEAGMTDREFELYRKDAEQAGRKAQDSLAVKLMKELKRERESWWKDEVKKVRAEVMDEVRKSPVYRALQEILKGKDFDGNEVPQVKMDRAELVKRYGEEFLKRLPKGSATEYLYTSNNGLHPDLVAERYGFSSGDEMIKKMIEAPEMKRYVVAEADMRMRERHGDAMLDGSMADEALKAVHNDHWAEVMRAEIKALKKKAKEVKPHVDEVMRQAKKDADMTARWYRAERRTEVDRIREQRRAMQDNIPSVQAFRNAAREQIAAKRAGDINPFGYLNAERKAAKEAFDAAAKGDYGQAADARTRQLLNHYLYLEAQKAKEQTEKIYTWVRKMSTSKEMGKLGKAGEAYLAQFQSILERYQFVKVSKSELIERQETLQQFLDRVRDEEGLALPIPPEIVDELQRPPNYKELTMEELRSVHDALRMIEHAAKRANSVRGENMRIEVGRAALALSNRLFRSVKGREVMERKSDGAATMLERLQDWGGDIPLMLPEFLFERFDGRKTGEWHDYIWDRYNEASDHQNRLRELAFPRIVELANSNKIDRSKGPIYIESIKASLTKDDIISIALNCGNESNLDKLMRGGLRFKGDDLPQELNSEQLHDILSHLSKDEIAIVNGIWQTIGLLKPEAAELSRKRTGIEPPWIEAAPMEIANGTLEGGYYPVKYDIRYSAAGEKQHDAASVDQMFNRYTRASTRQGYTKTRTEFAAPLKLDWQQIVSNHLDEVILDISHWEFVTDTQRLLKRPEVKNAIIERLGLPYYKNLLDWVRYTVNQDATSGGSDNAFEQARRAFRRNMSTYVLGFKVANAMVEMVVGVPLMMQHVPIKSAFHGVAQVLRGYPSARDAACELSDYMKHMDRSFDRDATEALNYLAGKHTVLDDIRRWSIECRQAFWKVGAVMAWHAGYDDAINNQGLQGKKAIHYADSIYRMTQESGRPGDLSAIQQNPHWREVTQFIGPTLIQYNNNVRAVRAVRDRGLNSETAQLLLKTFVCGHFANAVLFEAMRGNTSDDKKKIPAWILTRMTLGLLDGIPFLRDVGRYAEHKILGEPGGDLRLIPMLQWGKDAVDAAVKTARAVHGDTEWSKAIIQGSKVVGGATGLPTMQGSITGQMIADILTGEYEPEHPWNPVTDIFYYKKKTK